MKRNYTRMWTTAFLLITLVATGASAQQKPTTGYAPVNGLNMYYEVHGGGEPVVLLHGAFMTITNNWDGWPGRGQRGRWRHAQRAHTGSAAGQRCAPPRATEANHRRLHRRCD